MQYWQWIYDLIRSGHRVRRFALVLATLVYPLNAHAITPSDVYQKTEYLRLILQEKGLMDTQMYESIEADVALRHPRHVMQKVRECNIIIAKILDKSNIAVAPLPRMASVREIKPSDVMNGVEHLIDHVRKLGGVAAVGADYVEGKVPNDVYNNLKKICASMKAEILPSDVYRVVLAVKENIEKIARSRGYDFEIEENVYTDKVPKDVYLKTQQFLKVLRYMALNPDFAIPGGVMVVEPTQIKDVTPQDVIGLMHDALVETDAIKYTLHIREHSIMPPYEEGKTPSDVYAKIEWANSFMIKLLEEETLE